jgi:hypothetical protein
MLPSNNSNTLAESSSELEDKHFHLPVFYLGMSFTKEILHLDIFQADVVLAL